MDEGFQSGAFAQGPGDRTRSSRPLDVEFGTDMESGIALSADFNEVDSLKTFLDSNRDTMKLDAMKRIIKMVAGGRDCSELFPAVVKNVVSKEAEIRKLVYIYLTRYAEEQQDIALLSVSTFQRSLKDPNQLIRASALRVLCSTRIPMLVPIMLLAIRDASKDLSPYVRKTAAHAVPKVYNLDPSEKEQLVEIIERLLADTTTLVIGSAIRAFEEVCPDRLDLIHQHYRKLCSMILDVDEWGQVILINVLTRYARTQFLDPDRRTVIEEDIQSGKTVDLFSLVPRPEEKSNENSPPVSGTKQPVSNGDRSTEDYSIVDALPMLQEDYNLLTEACRFLLHSKNTAVIMAAAQSLFALKSKKDYPVIAKALARSLHEIKELQYVLLSNISTLSIEHPGLFEPYLHTFYCFSNDPLYIKLIKLDILGNLATETSSSTILREFQYYVTQPDHRFVTATIQAIGRCASTIPQIADICLNGLVRLMSRPDEKVVAECVVVLRKLLQMQGSDHKEIIIRIAQLTDTMTVPSALASILWLLGEYSHRVPKIAPDVLRKMAKTFISQESVVKLQILNLAAKLAIVNPKQTHLLAQYVFSLARYDQNYDIRDRSRLLRALIFPQLLCDVASGDVLGTVTTDAKSPTSKYLAKHARKICLAVKPAPVLQSRSKDRFAFVPGSLSHLLNRCVQGYRDLPDWPTVPPNPWSRIVPSSLPSETTEDSLVLSVVDHAVDTRSGKMLSLSDFFYESDEDSENEDQLEDVEEEVDSCANGAKDQKDDDDDDDDYDADWNSKPMGKVKRHLRTSPSDNDDNQDVSSDLVELDINSESSSDSELALGPLQHFIQRQEPILTSESPITTVTTEPSDSEERTFSSTLLGSSKSVALTQALMDIAQISDTETETTEAEEDEDLQSVDLIISSGKKKYQSISVTPPRPSGDCAIHALPTAPNKLSGTVSNDPELATNANKFYGLQGAPSEISETSSVTLPSLSPSNISTHDSQKPSLLSESPSIVIDSRLIPNVLNTTPTPQPTWNGSFVPSDSAHLMENEESVIHTLPTIPFPLSVDWKPCSETLRWFDPPTPADFKISVRYQFTRLFTENNPNLIIVRLKFINNCSDSHTNLSNLHLDSESTAIGRLLLDANRIEPFSPIDKITPHIEHYRTLGIDFAGFTDPIELTLAYTDSTAKLDPLIRMPLSISPPSGELIRPTDPMDAASYMKLKVELSNSHNTTQSTITYSTEDSLHFADPSVLVKTVLFTAHVRFHDSHLYSDPCSAGIVERHTTSPIKSVMQSPLVLQFTGFTVSDRQICLIELLLEHFPFAFQNEIIGDSYPSVAVSVTSKSPKMNDVEPSLVVTVLCPVHRIRTALCQELETKLRDALGVVA